MYAVIAENPEDPHGEILFERYTSDSTKESCEEFIEYLGGRYGKCRIVEIKELNGEENE